MRVWCTPAFPLLFISFNYQQRTFHCQAAKTQAFLPDPLSPNAQPGCRCADRTSPAPGTSTRLSLTPWRCAPASRESGAHQGFAISDVWPGLCYVCGSHSKCHVQVNIPTACNLQTYLVKGRQLLLRWLQNRLFGCNVYLCIKNGWVYFSRHIFHWKRLFQKLFHVIQ